MLRKYFHYGHFYTPDFYVGFECECLIFIALMLTAPNVALCSGQTHAVSGALFSLLEIFCFQVAAQCCGHHCPRHTLPVPVSAPSLVCTDKTCGITSENCIRITVPEGVSTTLGCPLKPFLLSLSEECCFLGKLCCIVGRHHGPLFSD